MTAEPFAPTAPLAVVLDVKSPESYLALAPTRALLSELGIAAQWLPTVAPQRRPPPAGDDRAARHKRLRAAYHEQDIARYAKLQGLNLQDTFRTADSTLAGMGMLAAQAHSDVALQAYLDTAFEGYWTGELNIEDAEEIALALAIAGVPTFEQDAEGFASLQASLAAAGVFAAPTYLVGGEAFLGRAHLPMIRWLLTGREGPGPI